MTAHQQHVPPAATNDRDTIVARARMMFETDVDGEVIALDPDTSDYFGFNATASELWRLIDRPCTIGALVTALTERFAVDEATCAQDVAAALDWLRGEGLVTLERSTPP